MKLIGMLLVSLGMAMAFQPQVTRPAVTSSLQMGLFDGMFKPKAKKEILPSTRKVKSDRWIENMFKEPLHGHGTAEKELDDMYAAQQKMLEERRKLFGSASALRAKYSNPAIDHLRDIPTHSHDPAMLNKKEDDAMYVDDDEAGDDSAGFNFNPFKKSSKFSP
ncbi:expressed unknown protein [Seminavis robusta]|uniref:Uncharacterized protein n=1 Tax=Seminavis robusta TaxID=568900 RepID=A0A9N8ES39_9STRA|nr:expressed unknown protein [Seminavis robusta]|eukprot:Sro1444_g273290.1 n/a (163) ;mRNA; r:22211-22699